MTGMHCRACERTIGTLPEDLDGVPQASADHRTGTVAITFDAHRLNRQDVAREPAGVGYAPKAWNRDA